MDPHTAPSRAHTSVRRNYVLTVPNQKYSDSNSSPVQMQFLASDPCVKGEKINTKIASQERVGS